MILLLNLWSRRYISLSEKQMQIIISPIELKYWGKGIIKTTFFYVRKNDRKKKIL
jgi:hypothetical protein